MKIRASAGQESEALDASFAELVHRHARQMFSIAFAVVRNAQDAEDAVQETFLKLYRGKAWLGMRDEKAFLARSVWRTALDRLSARGPLALELDELQVATSGESPEGSALRKAQAERLRTMIDVLPEELRQVLILHAIEDMTSREVAKVLGIAEGTVRTRLMRARNELKRRFEAAQGRLG